MINTIGRHGMGWIPDYPDIRDYTKDTKEIEEMFVNIGRKTKKALPGFVDIREWCSPIDDQGSLGSCTAHAGVGMIEYHEMRAFGKFTKASRLFLYKAARNLMKMKGDTGAFLRTTMGAMVLFGSPPEDYWQYTDDEEKFDIEPPAFCYAFAQNYQTIKYFRHDTSGISKNGLLEQIKLYLVSGHPPMFGFSVYSSIREAEKTGKIPFPSQKEKTLGGHAIMAVGYDDRMKIKNPYSKRETTGALLIRNSWGEIWGEKGYGWLPYDYVLSGLAQDFWSVLKKEWIDTAQFE